MPNRFQLPLRFQNEHPLPDLRLRIWREALKHHPRGIIVSTSAALGISVSLSSAASYLYWLWLLSMLAFSAVRYTLYLLCQADLERGMAHSRWQRLAMWHDAGMIFTALQWAMLAWWGIPHFSGAEQFTILIILSALAGGATATLAPLRFTGKIFIALVLLPACVELFLQGQPNSVTLATLGVIFAWVMITGHESNYRVLLHSLTLAQEKEGLVEALSEKTQEILHANAELEQRVATRTSELRHEAQHDALTALLNRRGLRARQAQWDENPEDLALLALIDLDRFKQINDSLGHDWGDSLLQAVARRLEGCAAELATQSGVAHYAVSRWGGDEFIVCAHGSPAAIHILQGGLESLRAQLALPYLIEGRTLNPGASLGCSRYRRADVPDLLQAIRLADLAASEAKRRGRNRTVEMTPALMAAHDRRTRLSEALRQATQDGSLALVFQPIVSSHTHCTQAYETLLRWHCPGLGPVSPVEFIPLAEEINQIEAIGEWVLRAGCHAASAWRAAPGAARPPKVAINASLKQLLLPAFAASVATSLAEAALPPAQLVIEVTESVFNETEIDAVLATLSALRRLGVDIHIDDFGTGYSSLSRLHEFPLTAVKVDKCFVHSGDARSLAVIEGTLLIARRFGLRVIAEGVETEAQADTLRRIGVDELQGYLFGRPGTVSAEHLPPAGEN